MADLTKKVEEFHLTPAQERQNFRKEPLAPKEMLGASDHLSLRSYLIFKAALEHQPTSMEGYMQAGILPPAGMGYYQK
ncbi:hypothetical protein HON71_04955 [Candidatus Woesearchaeota archaeon]|jgi:hypothetical protein|nr:hypothetical protein [Candidatus Woesearchaeota archaeon]MBT5342383.1 hypothetical protein [Candidatus Woesearchaeota archaeon]